MIRFLFLPPVFIKTQRSRHSTFEHITKIFNFIKHTPNKTWLLQSSPPPPQSSPTPPPSSASHPPSSASTRSSARIALNLLHFPSPRDAEAQRLVDNLMRIYGARNVASGLPTLIAWYFGHREILGPLSISGVVVAGVDGWVMRLQNGEGGVESLAFCAGGGGVGGWVVGVVWGVVRDEVRRMRVGRGRASLLKSLLANRFFTTNLVSFLALNYFREPLICPSSLSSSPSCRSFLCPRQSPESRQVQPKQRSLCLDLVRRARHARRAERSSCPHLQPHRRCSRAIAGKA